MKNKFIIVLIMLAVPLLSGCQSLWYFYLDTVVDIAPGRFTFEEKSTSVSIPVFTSQPVTLSNIPAKQLIVVIHGAGLNAGKSFAAGKQFAQSLGIKKEQSVIIAPQFLEGVEPPEDALLVWGRTWRSGGYSLAEKQKKHLPQVTSFDAMDRLLEAILKTHSTIKNIIILGHSAGGQFVLRYAAVNNHHEPFAEQGVAMRYVVANPSSYLYLDGRRCQFAPDGNVKAVTQEKLAVCPGYNNYKYGLDNRFGYSETLSGQTIRNRLLTRPIIFLLGTEDIEQDRTLDTSCEVKIQGKNRYGRGLLYKIHLKGYLQGKNTYGHIWLEIPDTGHDAGDVFLHPYFIKKMVAVLSDKSV